MIGAITVSRTSRSDAPLASIPLIFSAQQALEGVVWLTGAEGWGRLAAYTFALLAFCLWPLYTPLACWTSERSLGRRKAILALAILGAVVSAGAIFVLRRGLSIDFTTHHIRYLPVQRYAPAFDYVYALCAVGPLFLFKNIYIRIFGILDLASFGASMTLFHTGRYSVWCFFAAAISIVLYLFVESRNASSERRLLA
jgi:hypothetical protein